MTRKPTVEELGIDLDSQKWQRSGDEDGAIEVTFIPGVAVGAGVTSWAGHAAGGPAGSADPAGRTEWVLMRVAGDPARRVLVYDRHEWECFLDGVRGGEFDEGAPWDLSGAETSPQTGPRQFPASTAGPPN